MIEEVKLKPSRLFLHESDFGTTVASFLWQKIINNQHFVEKCFPIGYVLFFYASQTYANGTPVSPPNPEIWQPLNGTTVNDTDSPLHGVTLPDLRQLFLKGSSTQGITGGQLTINLQHAHGGQTGVTDDRQPDFQADGGGDYNTGAPHTHAIANSWSTAEPITPPYIDLQAYIRIK